MGWRGILGLEYGIVQAPLGPDISGPELVAAVANAGGLGLLRAPDWESPEYLKDLIRWTRTLTDKPFGVGIVMVFPHKLFWKKGYHLQLSWGEITKELVNEAHSFGVKVVPQVGSYEEAKRAIDSNVDAIIVQGVEAGGHVLGRDGLISVLPRVVDLVGNRDIPVIASGGIVDARGYVAALALGAQGIAMGTRFIATNESYARPTYKKKLIEMDKSEYTNVFGHARWPGAPQRVLHTPFFNDWKDFPDGENELSMPIIGHTTIHGKEREVRWMAGTVPNASTTGDIESMTMYAGEGVGIIKEILPAAEVIKRLVDGAQLLIQQKFHAHISD
ncbi:Nitronate monooxygenase [Dillenia turbinata]|uniref:Nitronate monooxygenase n=1 Tax=Dillenia turbinata TaxID=194707 RepID=A0AAN8WGW9_9MAGN